MATYDYARACESAAEAQGINAIRDALKARGIECEVWQTGGFTMVAAVPLERNARGDVARYIGCTGEGAGIVTEGDDGDCEEFVSLCETSAQSDADSARTIADSVCSWLASNVRQLPPPRDDATDGKTEGGILTVGALRNILANVDDSAQVVIAGDNVGLNYQNVKEVAVPDGHTFCAVTLFTADTYDPRQH